MSQSGSQSRGLGRAVRSDSKMSALGHRTEPGSAKVHISVWRGGVGPVGKDSWAVRGTFGIESRAESEDFGVEGGVALQFQGESVCIGTPAF